MKYEYKNKAITVKTKLSPCNRFQRKMVMITLYARQKKRHRCTEQTFGFYGRS